MSNAFSRSAFKPSKRKLKKSKDPWRSNPKKKKGQRKKDPWKMKVKVKAVKVKKARGGFGRRKSGGRGFLSKLFGGKERLSLRQYYGRIGGDMTQREAILNQLDRAFAADPEKYRMARERMQFDRASALDDPQIQELLGELVQAVPPVEANAFFAGAVRVVRKFFKF